MKKLSYWIDHALEVFVENPITFVMELFLEINPCAVTVLGCMDNLLIDQLLED
jgi:hypothetical protein